MNGKIIEVKQPQDQSNSKMDDHLGSIHFVFFSGRNIRQICPVLVISLNFGKTQVAQLSQFRLITEVKQPWSGLHIGDQFEFEFEIALFSWLN